MKPLYRAIISPDEQPQSTRTFVGVIKTRGLVISPESVTHVSVFPLTVVVLCVNVRAVPLTHPWPWTGVGEGAGVFFFLTFFFFHQVDVAAEPEWAGVPAATGGQSRAVL